MRSFRFSQQIDRTAEEIFAFMMDFRTAPRWRNMVRRMEVAGPGPVREGGKILLTMEVMGKTGQNGGGGRRFGVMSLLIVLACGIPDRASPAFLNMFFSRASPARR